MKKTAFIFIIGMLMTSCLVVAQSNPTISQINTDLPNLSPQTPTTSDLGKYGEIQVNESTGIISPSIPLFEYNAGKMSIPLTLNYSGNGVKVNQDPTWTGINWNINPGGVITRVVNDLPDEKTPFENKIYLSYSELSNLPGAFIQNDFVSDWHNKMEQLCLGSIDSEVDIFNYNFLGHSGSFFMDKYFNVHLVKFDKEVKIQYLNINNNENNNGFKIITSDGNVFFFGGSASESSKSFTNNGGGSSASADFIQNAYYLNQINFCTGGFVNFEYEEYNGLACSKKIGIQESTFYNPVSVCTRVEKDVLSITEKAVFLKRISNSLNDEIVEFEINNVSPCNLIIKLLNIKLKHGSNLSKKIQFNYLTIDTGIAEEVKKFYLTNVSYYNSALIFEKDYELSYNAPELFPSKSTYAQDELGYYNGENENISLLPITSNTLLNQNCNFLSKREAILEFAKFGSLYKIRYPTGGYSIFEYELPYKGKKQLFKNHHFEAYYRNPENNFISSNSVPVFPQGVSYYNLYYPDDFEDDQDTNTTTISETSEITVKLNLNKIGIFTQHANVKVSAIKVNSTGESIVWTSGTNGNGFPLNSNGATVNETYQLQYTTTLPPGVYKFLVSIYLYPINENSSVIAKVDLLLPNQYKKIYYPGLRIKKVITSDENGTTKTSKYFYNTLENKDVESFSFNPNYVNLSLYFYPESTNLTNFFLLQHNLSTNNIRNNFHNNSGAYVYKYVTVSEGENFENGGKQMKFMKSQNGMADYYSYIQQPFPFQNPLNNTGFGLDSGTIPDIIKDNVSNFVAVGNNHSYDDSMKLEEIVFTSNFRKKSKIEYHYEGTIDKTMNNIKTYPYCPPPKAVAFLTYPIHSYKYRLLTTENTEYFGIHNDSIKSKTIFTYNGVNVSLPKTIVTTNSKLQQQKKVIFYPTDLAYLPNLTYEDLTNINTLITKNNISEIVRTEDYLMDTLLETKQVRFNNWSGKILPKTIMTSKGLDALEERVEFLEYNSSGKPTLVSLKNGTKIKYVYNLRQQVIFKIENYEMAYSLNSDGTTESDGGYSPIPFGECEVQSLYPKSRVTQYVYDPITYNLIKIIDPKCDVINYNYDFSNRLKSIQDKEGNVLSENIYNYKSN